MARFIKKNGGLQRVENASGIVKIPDHITKINSGVIFDNYAQVEKIIIPSSVTEIEESTFYYRFGGNKLLNLKEVIILGPITSIPERAFSQLRKLERIELPDTVRSIGDYAFKECDSLKEIKGIQNVTHFGEGAFRNCPLLKDENGFVYAGDVLYGYYGDEKEITIPDGIRIIDDLKNNKIRKVIIPESLEEIGDSACKEMNIEEVLFQGNSCLRSIGRTAFEKCHNLRNFLFPASLEFIGFRAFDDCKNLSYQDIDPQVEVEERAFINCCKYADQEGFIIIHSVLHGYCGDKKHAIIPENVSYIGKAVLMEAKFEEVTIPSTCKSIWESAFCYCNLLKTVHMEEGVMEIEDTAFRSCKDLRTFQFPKSIEKIGTNLFDSCDKLKEIIFFDSVDIASISSGPDKYTGVNDFIGKRSYGYNSDSGLYISFVDDSGQIIEKIYCNPHEFCYLCDRQYDLYDGQFENASKTVKENMALTRLTYPNHLPDDRKKKYQLYLKRVLDHVLIPYIDQGDLDEIIRLSSMDIFSLNNIDKIITYVKKKGDVRILTWLEDYKAEHFKKEMEIARKKEKKKAESTEEWKIGKKPDEISYYLGDKQDVVFPLEYNGSKIKAIATKASKTPDNYKMIKSIVIPEGYTSIGNNAFRGCVSLERVVLPSTLKTIGSRSY